MKFKIGSTVSTTFMFDDYEVKVVGHNANQNKYQLQWPAGGTFWARESELRKVSAIKRFAKARKEFFRQVVLKVRLNEILYEISKLL